MTTGRAHDRVLEARLPFSLETGEPSSLPATRPMPVYDVVVDGDDVFVEVPRDGGDHERAA